MVNSSGWSGLARVVNVATALGVLVTAVGLLTGSCGVKSDPGPVCPAGGCSVPRTTPRALSADPAPLYVPLCHDVADETGPCVDRMGTSRVWVYVPKGAVWPIGQQITLCPTEDGGPQPCAWVPSVQNNNQGDSGAYVYGTADAMAAVVDCSTTMMFGPCVYIDVTPSGQRHWFYVAKGGMYPDRLTTDLGALA